MIGIAIMIILFAFLCIFIDIIKCIKLLVQGIGTVIIVLVEYFFRQKIEDKNMRDEEQIKLNIEKEKQKEIQKQIDIEKNKNKQHEKNMVYAILNKINEFNFKYPYADQDLVNEYKNNFYSLNIFQLQQLEQRIINSHYRNCVSNEETPNYTYADVEGLTPTETKTEFPIAMKLYRINTDYVLVVHNLLSNTITMYQSKNYMPILDLCNSILNRIYEIKNSKQSIKSIDVDQLIVQNNLHEIHKMRERNIIDKINKGMNNN